jgi:hypothetical protein
MCMLKSMSLINLAKFLVVVVVGDGGQKVGGWKGRKGKPFFSLVQSELRLGGLLQCSGGPPCLIYRGFAVVVAKIRRVLFFFFPILTLVYASLTWTTTIIRRPRALHHLLSALDVHIYSFTVDLEPSLPPASPW